MDVLTIQWGWIGGKAPAVTPPQPPAQQAAGNVRHLRYVEPLFKLSDEDRARLRRKREEEEIVIL
jgi:hypothetical protein